MASLASRIIDEVRCRIGEQNTVDSHEIGVARIHSERFEVVGAIEDNREVRGTAERGRQLERGKIIATFKSIIGDVFHTGRHIIIGVSLSAGIGNKRFSILAEQHTVNGLVVRIIGIHVDGRQAGTIGKGL